MKKVFILDLDGTLADSHQSLSASIEYVERRAAAARKAMGETAASEAKSSEPWPVSSDGKITDAILERHEVSLHIAEELVNQVYYVIRQLYEEGIQIAVTSNKPTKLTEALMKHLAVDTYIEGVYGPDSAGEPKPHPAMVHRVLQDLAARPEDVLFVGDELVDVGMAHAAGVQVAIVIGAATRTQVTAEAPDYLLHDWAEVPSLTKAR